MVRKKKKRLALIDGHSLLFKAYHAYPPLTTSKGELVNAVYGFTNILLTVIKKLKPTHLAVTFDKDKPTFRHSEFVGYKAQREEMPTELADQQERVQEVIDALNIPTFAVEGYEADDVIGTLAEQVKQQATSNKKPDQRLDEVVVVTGDMDVLQLVDSDKKVKVRVYVPGRGRQPSKMYDEKGVEKKYGGLEPEQIPDFKGLAGDASDNIPGVKGVGPKTASVLLRKYGTIEKLYEALGLARLPGRSRRAQGNKVDLGSLSVWSSKIGVSESMVKKLVDGYEMAVLSKRLATIVRDVPIQLKLSDCLIHDYDKQGAVELFQELEFKSLIPKLPNDDFEQTVQEAMF